MGSIHLHCSSQFHQAREFADKQGLNKSLRKVFLYLANYSDHPTRCEIYPDFAPYSFKFTMRRLVNKRWVDWFNGGIIYHGPLPELGIHSDQVNFSITLDPQSGWQIHT